MESDQAIVGALTPGDPRVQSRRNLTEDKAQILTYELISQWDKFHTGNKVLKFFRKISDHSIM